jgi:hypothetical protein
VRRSFGRLLLGAVLAGSVVAALSAVLGVRDCRGVGQFANECRGLVRTLSINMGALTAVVTAVMALFVAGLGRMSEQDEADRRERRLEAFREELEG